MLRKSLLKLELSILLWSASCCYAGADEALGIETELSAEVRESSATAAGGEIHRFAPAGVLAQGQIVYYTVRIKNTSPTFARDVAVVQRVPANTSYVAGSAAAPAAAVTFSVDGGLTFAPADQLTLEVAGRRQPAEPAQYTHIRWQLRFALAPGASALARFQAVFQ